MYGGIEDNVEYMHNFAETVGLPEISNGYWLFKNDNNTELLNSASYNFSLAIFDTDKNILYFFTIDT